jgi:hypothetical protein
MKSARQLFTAELLIRVPQTRLLFISTHNETLSIAAMRISNEDRSPARIHG